MVLARLLLILGLPEEKSKLRFETPRLKPDSLDL
jgi:hypothetical protein